MSSGTSEKPLIQVIGSLNVDLMIHTPRVPNAGETLTTNHFATYAGGKGGNQAVACARASRPKPKEDGNPTKDETVRVEHVGALGDDTYADLLLSTLGRNGVGCEHITKVSSTNTGMACVIVEESGENRIMITPGANGLVQPQMTWFSSTSSRSAPDLVVLQLEIDKDVVIDIIQRARSAGIDVLLNPAPAVELPNVALAGVHLILNETEAEILTGARAPSNESAEAMTTFLDQAFSILVGRGVKYPIITLGGRGVAYLKSTKNGKPSWALLDAHKVSRVVDTTAAGDSFVGYYAVGFVEAKRRGDTVADDWTPADVVAWANTAAARTVTKAGAMESVPWRDELKQPQ